MTDSGIGTLIHYMLRFLDRGISAGDVRVYLVGYIFYIIDFHICRDIFGRIDIMYCRLPYVSRGVLPLKTLVLYIYQSRGTMQYNQQLYAIYSSYTSVCCTSLLAHPHPQSSGSSAPRRLPGAAKVHGFSVSLLHGCNVARRVHMNSHGGPINYGSKCTGNSASRVLDDDDLDCTSDDS
jgi:hypothetical protein